MQNPIVYLGVEHFTSDSCETPVCVGRQEREPVVRAALDGSIVMLVALYMMLPASHRTALLWLPATLLSCDRLRPPPLPPLPRSTLPFTGLDLWLPALLGLGLNLGFAASTQCSYAATDKPGGQPALPLEQSIAVCNTATHCMLNISLPLQYCPKP